MRVLARRLGEAKRVLLPGQTNVDHTRAYRPAPFVACGRHSAPDTNAKWCTDTAGNVYLERVRGIWLRHVLQELCGRKRKVWSHHACKVVDGPNSCTTRVLLNKYCRRGWQRLDAATPGAPDARYLHRLRRF